jgi:hypothetical protein
MASMGHCGRAQIDHRDPYVGYWDGMDVERIINDIEQLQGDV